MAQGMQIFTGQRIWNTLPIKDTNTQQTFYKNIKILLLFTVQNGKT